MIDIRKLKELVKLMVENDLAEIDLGDENEKVVIKRGLAGQLVSPQIPAPMMQAAGAPQAAPATAEAPPPVEPPDNRAADEAAIHAAGKEWSAAAQAKDPDKFASFYAEDGVLMLEDAPDAHGIEALRAGIVAVLTEAAAEVERRQPG